MKNLDKDIDILKLGDSINNILINNNIRIINDLWILNKKFLKGLNLTSKDINTISIKLQLIGLDLNKKVY